MNKFNVNILKITCYSDTQLCQTVMHSITAVSNNAYHNQSIAKLSMYPT